MKLSRNGELPYYLGVFLEITHDATKELLKYNMNDIVIVLIVLIKNVLRVMEFSEIEYYPKIMGAIRGGGGGGGGGDFERGGRNPSANYAVTM